MVRFIAIMMICSPAALSAQTELGVRAGLNVSDIVMTNYINPDVESDLGLKLGLHAGIFVNGKVDERIGMAAELLYSNKGVKGPTNIHLHYITIPMLVLYQLSDNVYAEAGPALGYLFSARSALGNMSSTYNNKFDLSLDGGFRFRMSRVLAGVRYCVGVFSVREPIPTNGAAGNETIKYQNRVLQLSFGYKLWMLE